MRGAIGRYLTALVTILVISLLGVLPTSAFAAGMEENSTYGTEFWTVFMSNSGAVVTDISIELTVYVILKEPATETVNILVDVGGATVQTISFQPGERFKQSERLDVASAYLQKTTEDAELTTNKGVRIYSENENTAFACYTHCRQGNIGSGGLTQDASLVYPTRVLGREYVVQTYEKDAKSTEFAVVATEDNTEIVIVPSCTTFSNSWTAGTPRTVTLNAGQTFFVPSYTMPENSTTEVIDLSGSTVCASRPVAVVTGHEQLKVPLNQAYSGDHAMEQVLPIANFGSLFYVALASKSTNNAFKITAAFDSTVVTVRNGNNTITTTLNAGESTPLRGYAVTTALPTAVITTSQPALCYTYENCGATNNEFDPDLFVTTSWGNPGNAMNPSWEHRLKSMTFFTREMEPEMDEYGDAFQQKHFVQIITATSDISTFTLDGEAVPSSAFTAFAADGTKAFANIELPADSYGFHEITTSGGGFIGEVYGITNGQSYMYTLGFNPNPFRDSLFIQNPEAIMSSYSYDLERKEQGWYQRQLDDWLVKDEMRVDTAYICDSTILNFNLQLAKAGGIDSIVWQVINYDTTGVIREDEVYRHTTPEDSLSEINQLLGYQFALDPQKNKMPKDRTPWDFFRLEVLLYRSALMCDRLEEQIDTFATMVHVARVYKDTISRRVICINDSIRFFYDDEDHLEARPPYDRDSTTFVHINHQIYHQDDPYVQYFNGLGDTVYTRTYQTIFGCDSIMSLQLHICDTFFVPLDTFVCENHIADLKFPDKFLTTKFDSLESKIYYDTLKTKDCIPIAAQFGDQLFEGCDSVIALYVHVVPVPRDTIPREWCAPDPDLPETHYYVWRDDYKTAPDDTIMKIHYQDPRFKMNKGRLVGYFSDTLCNDVCADCVGACEGRRGCDSIRVLRLTQVESYRRYEGNRQYTSYCDSIYDWNTHTLSRRTDYVWEGHQYNVEDIEAHVPVVNRRPRELWNKTNGSRILSSELTYLPAGYYEILDSLVSTGGCDSIWTLRLTVHHVPVITQSWSMPDNETYAWEGHTNPDNPEETPWILGPFAHDTIIYDNIPRSQAEGACDSIFELHIKIGETFFRQVSMDMCDNDSIGWEDHIYAQDHPTALRRYYDVTNRRFVLANELQGFKRLASGYAPGTYILRDSLKTIVTDAKPIQADSVWELKLIVHPTYEYYDTVRICNTDTFSWQKRLYKGDLFAGTIDGTRFDSVLTLTPGSYDRDTLYQTKANSCDSLFRLHVQVYESYYFAIEDSVACQDDAFVWTGHEGRKYLNENGDSVYISTAEVGDHIYIDHLYSKLCDTCHNSFGCDSVYTLRLHVNPSYIGDRIRIDQPEVICATDLPFIWNGEEYFASDTYTKVFTLPTGCDSIAQFTLTVIDNEPKTLDTTVCNDAEPFTFGLQQLYVSPADSTVGLHTATQYVTIGEGCGYMETLNIIISQVYDDLTDADEVCQTAGSTYTWQDHDKGDHIWDEKRQQIVAYNAIPLDDAGTFTFIDSLKTVAGCQCDSIYTLTLTIHPSYDTTTTTVISQEQAYFWSGDNHWYYGPDGLEQVPEDQRATATLCPEGLFPVDSFYTSIHGCDSIWRLRLTIGNVFRDTVTEHTCDSVLYEWKRDGKYVLDSVVRTIDVAAMPNDTVLYFDSLRTSHNYDSIYILELIRHPRYYIPVYDTVCQGAETDSLDWLGHKLPIGRAGLVLCNDTDTTHIYHCDSIHAMHLQVLPSYHFSEGDNILKMSNEDTLRWQHRLYVGEHFRGTVSDPDAIYVTSSPYLDTVIWSTRQVGSFVCDSAFYLTLTIGKVTRDTLFDRHTCDNTPYDWYDKEDTRYIRTIGIDEMPNDTNYYSDTVRTALDYDSICVLQLIKHPTYHKDNYGTICQGEEYIWEGHEGNILRDSIRGINVLNIITDSVGEFILIDSLKTQTTACDTICHLHLTVTPTYNNIYNKVIDTLEIFDYDIITWQGQTIGPLQAGDYRDYATYDTVTKNFDCDSIRFLRLIVTLTDTICKDSLYFFHGERIDTHLDAGQYYYRDTLSFADGTDSIASLRLFVPTSYSFRDTILKSDEDSAHWQGNIYVGEKFAGDTTGTNAIVVHGNTYLDTAHYFAQYDENPQHVCDSIYYLTLRIGKVYRDTTYAPVCGNCQYTWRQSEPLHGRGYNDGVYSGKGYNADTTFYYDSLKTCLGFDSIFVLKLYSYPVYDLVKVDTICQNLPYDWLLHEEHLLYDSVRQTYTSTIPTYEDGWFTFVDSLHTQTYFRHPITDETQQTRCDSVWTLRLFIPKEYAYTVPVFVCDNDTTTWENRLYVGNHYDGPFIDPTPYFSVDTVYAGGPYTEDTLYHSIYSCDSIITLSLTVGQTYRTHFSESIDDRSPDWAFCHLIEANCHFGTEYLLASEELYDTTNIRQPYTRIYIDTVPSVLSSCDSILFDTVTIYPVYINHKYDTTCSNATYNWREEYTDRFMELNHSASNTYYDSLTNQYGKDSIFILHLTVLPSFNERVYVNLCKNDTIRNWKDTKDLYYDPLYGDRTVTYEAVYETDKCDEIYTWYVSYHNYYHTYDTIEICEGDVIDWDTISVSIPGDYVIRRKTSFFEGEDCDCDSIHFLHLTNKPRYYYEQYDTVCLAAEGTYTWINSFGKSIRTDISTADSGHYVFHDDYRTVLDCDSNFTLNLYVAPIYFFDETDTICGNEINFTYHRNGVPVTYHLELDDVPDPEKEVKDFEIWDSCHTVGFGCDSIYRMRINLRPDEYIDSVLTICLGDTTYLHDRPLWQAGTYRDTLPNQWGCNVFTTLHLYTVEPTRFTLGEPAFCANARSYAIPFSFTPDSMPPMSFSLYYTDSAKTILGFEDVIAQDIPEGATELIIDLPALIDTVDYPRPGGYMATLYFDNGICLDSNLLQKPLSFQVLYPKWIIEQHWNDFVGVLSAAYNGGYDFDSFRWYKNGQPIPGETKPYLYEPHWLNGNTYAVELTRVGESISFLTCDLEVDTTRYDALCPTLPYISVVPTYVVRENPIINILSTNDGNYAVYNSVGSAIISGRFLPDSHNAFEVVLPPVSGTYIVKMIDDFGLTREVKVIVN